MLSLGLGMIFIVSFIGLNLKRIANWFTNNADLQAIGKSMQCSWSQ